MKKYLNKIDDIGLKLCDYQANIFEESVPFFNCSSSYFIRIYMNSALAKRMDDVSFIIESNDVNSYLLELKYEYKTNVGKEKYPKYVMHWIGYLYRYFAYTYGFSSKNIYKIIKPKELFGLYESYHSLDTEEAIERIIESKNLNFDTNILDIAKKYYLSN